MLKWIVTVCIVAGLVVPAAMAGNPTTPPFAQSNGASASPSTVVAPHHGLKLSLRLNPTISDGNTAAFYLIIRKTAGAPVQFASVAIGWSWDGKSPSDFATYTSSTTQVTTFVDPDHNWARVGTLSAGQTYKLSGQVNIADRRGFVWQSRAHPKAPSLPQFYCLQVVVRSSLPGKPNATYDEMSGIVCQQYSVR